MRPVHRGVSQGVACPIETGSLAVPDADDSVVCSLPRGQFELAAPDGRRGQLLVHPWNQSDVVLGCELRDPCQQLVEGGERAALVAGHEGGDTLSGAQVTLVLFHQQPRNCLNPGHEYRSGGGLVAAGKIEIGARRLGDLHRSHLATPFRGPPDQAEALCIGKGDPG